MEYEMTRRDSERFYHETWKNIKALAKKNSQLRGEFKFKMREQFIENMAKFKKMRENDGFDGKRFGFTKELSAYFQKSLHESQNPENCDEAKYLVGSMVI